MRETLKEPLKIEEWACELDKKKFGPRYKKDGKSIEDAILALSQDMREKLSISLTDAGKIAIPVPAASATPTDADGNVEVAADVLTIARRTCVENTREYVPNVIEPSFGIGRILYSLIEHSFWTRPGDEARGVLSFPPPVAPTKVLIVPLSNHPDFAPLVKRLSAALRKRGISNRVDDSSASIGKRYARNDELGTPLGITVDFESVSKDTFTLRDRDSCKQVRAGEGEICEAVRALVDGVEVWADVEKRLPAFEGQEVEVEAEA